ncbi:MAG: hypothetical protein KDA79_12105 [Planctomycetaceae bacterium]|nr:hypothetical protein [Planctomycetaceae bacterium]
MSLLTATCRSQIGFHRQGYGMSSAGAQPEAGCTGKQYICPGETYPISRAVHLSRLASFFPACRTCALRTDTGSLSAGVVQQLEQTSQRTAVPSLFQRDGVRGIFLNVLTRPVAAGIASALASILWEQAPRAKGTEAGPGTRPLRPRVVIGHDERPSSPLLVTGVAEALRRMSCQVIDISLSTWPCFRFTTDHLDATAGIFITGSGCDPACNGLEIVTAGAVPLSYGPLSALPAVSFRADRLDDGQNLPPVLSRLPAGSGNAAAAPAAGPQGGLNRIEQLAGQTFSRPSRNAGPQESFLAAVPYEAGLWKHFHALRPLRVVCGSPVRLVRQTLARLFEKLPCELQLLELPVRKRNVHDARDADLLRVGAAVRQRSGSLGLVIDDDGARCGFLDENGHHVPAADVMRVIIHRLLVDHPGAAVVVEPEAAVKPLLPGSLSRETAEAARPAPATGAGATTKAGAVADELSARSDDQSLRRFVEFAGGITVAGGTSQEEMDRLMRRSSAVAGGGSSGRVWFREGFPVCDAVLTLARVLGTLSRDDMEFSRLVRQLRQTGRR